MAGRQEIGLPRYERKKPPPHWYHFTYSWCPVCAREKPPIKTRMPGRRPAGHTPEYVQEHCGCDF